MTDFETNALPMKRCIEKASTDWTLLSYMTKESERVKFSPKVDFTILDKIVNTGKKFPTFSVLYLIYRPSFLLEPQLRID